MFLSNASSSRLLILFSPHCRQLIEQAKCHADLGRFESPLRKVKTGVKNVPDLAAAEVRREKISQLRLRLCPNRGQLGKTPEARSQELEVRS
jgi:hypothetical protein